MSHIAMVFRHLFQQGGYLFGLVEIKQEYSKIESKPKEDSHLILAVFHWLEGCVPSAVGCVPLTGRGAKNDALPKQIKIRRIFYVKRKYG